MLFVQYALWGESRKTRYDTQKYENQVLPHIYIGMEYIGTYHPSIYSYCQDVSGSNRNPDAFLPFTINNN